MFALREVRNIVQHQGDIPSRETIIKYKAYTEDFFKKIALNLFGITYEELFLSVLIAAETLKEHLLEAERAFGNAEHTRCIHAM